MHGDTVLKGYRNSEQHENKNLVVVILLLVVSVELVFWDLLEESECISSKLQFFEPKFSFHMSMAKYRCKGGFKPRKKHEY